MGTERRDNRLGETGRTQVVCVTYEEMGKWCEFAGSLAGLHSLMTRHGRVWDVRRGAYRRGENARDNRRAMREWGFV